MNDFKIKTNHGNLIIKHLISILGPEDAFVVRYFPNNLFFEKEKNVFICSSLENAKKFCYKYIEEELPF